MTRLLDCCAIWLPLQNHAKYCQCGQCALGYCVFFPSVVLPNWDQTLAKWKCKVKKCVQMRAHETHSRYCWEDPHSVILWQRHLWLFRVCWSSPSFCWAWQTASNHTRQRDRLDNKPADTEPVTAITTPSQSFATTLFSAHGTSA